MKCKKCGKNAGFNKWEMCKDCRRKKCKNCGNTFSNAVDRDFCPDCHLSFKQKAQKAGDYLEWGR